MFCVQGSKDPLALAEDYVTLSDNDEDDEPPAKIAAFQPNLNLTVYKIPAYNDEFKKSLYKQEVFKKRYSAPESTTITPTPHYDLTPVRYKKNGEVAKKRGPPKGYKRKPKAEPVTSYLSSSLTITPVLGSSTKSLPPLLRLPNEPSLTISPAPPDPASRHNATNQFTSKLLPHNAKMPYVPIPTVAEMDAMAKALESPAFGKLTLVQRNAILSGLLMSNAMKMTDDRVDMQELLKQMGIPSLAPMVPSSLTITPERLPPPQVVVPKGYEQVLVEIDPEDLFPSEPYRMTFSRKKNPKWKSFPYRCEHCFKGYRVASSLISHAGDRHGCVPKELAIPCPCCQHVSTRRKQHRRHLASHAVRKNKLFCLYCIPPQDPSEEYMAETLRFPYDQHPEMYFASEESLRLHRKRKHPYAAYFNNGWYYQWMDGVPNS